MRIIIVSFLALTTIMVASCSKKDDTPTITETQNADKFLGVFSGKGSSSNGSYTVMTPNTDQTPPLKYSTAERKYNRAQILRVFSKESQGADELKLLASVLKVSNKTYKDYIKEQKAANVTQSQMVTAVDTAIEALVDKILNEKIYKN